MNRRYEALHTIMLLCRITAGVVLVATISMAALIEAFAADRLIGAGLSVIAIICGTVLTLLLFALAEGIKVIVDIERNTRRNEDDPPEPQRVVSDAAN
jgi:hypothetical protein